MANSHRLAFVEAVHAVPAVTVATTGAALQLFQRETPQVFLGNLTKNDFSFSRHGITSLLPNQCCNPKPNNSYNHHKKRTISNVWPKA